MKRLRFLLPFILGVLILTSSRTLFAQVEMQTQAFDRSDAGIALMDQAITEGNDINLLTFPGTQLVEAADVSEPQLMTDGSAGQLAAAGRVQVNGNPSIITFYLGRPRSIYEISVWTQNGDQRSNQDFEIRVANNTDKPGKMPEFPTEATFSSGEKILGTNSGGFKTSFSDASGRMLVDEKVDWIQFKLWRTYKLQAGSSAKQGKGSSWTSLVELQVLADPNDPALFSSEKERNAWLAQRARKRAVRRLQEVSPDLVSTIETIDSVELAIDDLTATYPDRYTKGAEYKSKLAEYKKQFVVLMSDESLADPATVDKLVEVAKEFDAFRREALLSNPLMQDFDQLIVRKSKNPGLMANWVSSCSRGKGNYGAEIMSLSPPLPDGELSTLITPPGDTFIGDINLHWDADRMLLTALGSNNRWQIFEANTDGTDLHQVTPGDHPDVDNAEACYVPDGAVIYSSTASMLGVPCVAGSQMVANLYRLEADRQTVRQITFEQDQDWCPITLHNGRIMYLRWEYTDNSHYFTRIIMAMNPDGTNQMSYYGSNSFWPNSLFFAKPIPNHPSKFVGVVSGHHGNARMGELHIFDPAKGRKEADGAVQQIPGYGKPVEPKIVDRLVDASWPKFLHPAPLNEKYFLVSAKMDESSQWGIYLVDIYDNMVPVLLDPSVGYFEPTPVIKRPTPPIIPPRIYPQSDEATVFLSDIYAGPGLEGVPVGTVKQLRIFSYGYGYRNIGGHDKFGMESSWDAKRILGTVPVKEDGSAVFKVPANTPISLQPLDEEGRALQIMRSWMVAMPGEVLSCVGCHEAAGTAPGRRFTASSLQLPDDIKPWHGPARPFSYEHEVQPVLDKYCVGCHDGEKPDRPNFADTATGPRGFSNSYHALHGYVRRPGPESDVHVLRPLEYHASTSELFQILERGHMNVEMDREAMEKLYCWADLNVPYFGTWTDIANAVSEGKTFRGDQAPIDAIADRYYELRELYATAAFNMEAEAERPLPKTVKFISPEPSTRDWPRPTEPKGWPLSEEDARRLQAVASVEIRRTVQLDDSTALELVRIPTGSFVMGDTVGTAEDKPNCVATIDQPYWMMSTEVTNALFNRYFPEHDSRFIDQQWKDHTTPGYPANQPNQPVIRISWEQAMEFCRKLSEETGMKFTLPTEAQWEWACRAGTDQPFWFGDEQKDFSPYANLADESLRKFVVKGVNPKPVSHEDFQAFIPRAVNINDGNMIAQDVASYEPSPWGLYDMHGSVAEWTRSDFRPYPYDSGDGRNAGDPSVRKVVRGGSWRDRPERARSGFRLGYQPWQRVFNVGFRVICEE